LRYSKSLDWRIPRCPIAATAIIWAAVLLNGCIDSGTGGPTEPSRTEPAQQMPTTAPGHVEFSSVQYVGERTPAADCHGIPHCVLGTVTNDGQSDLVGRLAVEVRYYTDIGNLMAVETSIDIGERLLRGYDRDFFVPGTSPDLAGWNGYYQVALTVDGESVSCTGCSDRRRPQLERGYIPSDPFRMASYDKNGVPTAFLSMEVGESEVISLEVWDQYATASVGQFAALLPEDPELLRMELPGDGLLRERGAILICATGTRDRRYGHRTKVQATYHDSSVDILVTIYGRGEGGYLGSTGTPCSGLLLSQ